MSTLTSSRPTLAVDVDDVIYPLVPILVKYYRQYHDADSVLTPAHFFSYNFCEVWGGSVERAIDIVRGFFGSEMALSAQPIYGVLEALAILQEYYKLVIVTARQREFTDMTTAWLDCHFPRVFAGYYFGNHYALEGNPLAKSELCRQAGARIIIDDQPRHVLDCQNAGITSILFGQYPWQDANHIPEGILRAADWPAVLALLSP